MEERYYLAEDKDHQDFPWLVMQGKRQVSAFGHRENAEKMIAELNARLDADDARLKELLED